MVGWDAVCANVVAYGCQNRKEKEEGKPESTECGLRTLFRSKKSKSVVFVFERVIAVDAIWTDPILGRLFSIFDV